jgi:hypothetical protein
MPAIDDLQRICVKVYAPEPKVGDQEYVPIFHEWIRGRALDGLVLFDVADYAHVPESPGVVLVTHEAHFALDRSDGRFGLLVQRRVDMGAPSTEVIATTVRQALEVVDKLESDPRLQGRLRFDRSTLRVESNDRLRAPNTDDGWRAFEPVVKAGVAKASGDAGASVSRVRNDPRDRLAADVKVASAR